MESTEVINDLKDLTFAHPDPDRAYIVSGKVVKQLKAELNKIDHVRYALKEIGVQLSPLE